MRIQIGDKFKGITDGLKYERHVAMFEVTKKYPYFIVARDIKTGNEETFNYGDLVILGVEDGFLNNPNREIYGIKEGRRSFR